MNAEDRFLGRFEAEFKKGLANVKFFVRPRRMSVTGLFEEINQFEEAVHAGDFRVVESIDSQFPKTRFDAAFD